MTIMYVDVEATMWSPDEAIESGSYDSIDLYYQVTDNRAMRASWPHVVVGRAAGSPLIDEDAEWVYWRDDSYAVGLEDDYIKSYFTLPLNAEDVSRPVERYLDGHIANIENNGDYLGRYLSHGEYFLSDLNQYIYIRKLVTHLKRLRVVNLIASL